jgi:hypothetical protein
MDKKLGNNEVENQRRIACLDFLLLRSGVDSVLIGVPKLSRILGIGCSTIYTYMRENRFFLPYRLVNGTPMVKIDDLIEWYVNPAGDISPLTPAQPLAEVVGTEKSGAETYAELAPSKSGRKPSFLRSPKPIQFCPSDVVTQQAADNAVDGLVANVMKRIERHQRESQTAARCT